MALSKLVEPVRAALITGITDEDILEFYINSVICLIEKTVGYPLSKTQRIDYINGLNTRNLWLYRKPVETIIEVKDCNDTVIDSDNYSLRNAENTPHLVFTDRIICHHEELAVESIAGFDDYDAPAPANYLNLCIESFIYAMVKLYESSLNNGDLKSYKIDTISYTFTTWLEKQNQFSQGLSSIGLI